MLCPWERERIHRLHTFTSNGYLSLSGLSGCMDKTFTVKNIIVVFLFTNFKNRNYLDHYNFLI